MSGTLPDFRQYFFRHILWPVVLLAVAVVVAGIAGLHWTGDASNQAAIQRQTRIARLALSSSADQIAYEQQTVGTWEQLPVHLARAPGDMVWLDAEIGQWLCHMFRHDMTFILDGRGRPIYAFYNGRSASPATFAKVAPDLNPLIQEVRHGTGASLRAAEQARSTVLTRSTTVFASDALKVLGRPAAVSVMRIASGAQAPPAGVPLMVSVRYLDGAYLKQLSALHLLRGLRFSLHPSAGPEETMVQFHDQSGKPIGWFFWKPELPGNRVLRALGPGAAVLTLALLGIMAALLLTLWRSGRQLSSAVLDLQASEAQAQHLAFHDVLTGLANRALFHDRLDQALARVHRGEQCAILAVDLDRFKQVNDTLGHAAGDTLIREFAGRLASLVRDMDTVARIGGDEFSILVCDAADRRHIDGLCERILAAVHRPFTLLGTEVFVGASIGVALVPDAGTDRGELLRKADIALYRAKSEGRGRYSIFAASMDETVKLRSQIEDDLRHAVMSNTGLEVHYQPEVDASSGQICGFEALLRWTHPVRGEILPQQFIPIAEETGLILPLGEWVLQQACTLAAKWPKLFVAVNISAVQFRSADLAERIIDIAQAARCSPGQIELEITEGVLLQEEAGVNSILEKLRSAGFRVALDDFGTGYSSLSYLRRFKVDKIKIDRSFTHSLGQDGDAGAIIASVITLGHAMGLTVTAEGVESREQMQLLSQAGCNELQGFLFAKALPEAELGRFLDDETAARNAA